MMRALFLLGLALTAGAKTVTQTEDINAIVWKAAAWDSCEKDSNGTFWKTGACDSCEKDEESESIFDDTVVEVVVDHQDLNQDQDQNCVCEKEMAGALQRKHAVALPGPAEHTLSCWQLVLALLSPTSSGCQCIARHSYRP